MKLTKVHLFVILLLALVFCSFFSGVCGGSGYGSTLEAFNMPNDGQYSAKNQYGNANANTKGTDSRANDNDDASGSSYAPYNSNSNSKNSKNSKNNGISGSQIPHGQEDLYMLKSEIVPPVCPACPAMKCDGSNGDGGEKKCPPCPPCARCPEPAFECKKVPNYNTANDNVFPHPVLNSFSQFGM